MAHVAERPGTLTTDRAHASNCAARLTPALPWRNTDILTLGPFNNFKLESRARAQCQNARNLLKFPGG
eukprot:2825674-Lingulodinium_polyedra.AAC.1